MKIQEADAVRDREELILFLRENLSEAGAPARFDWLYLRNPSGQARAWIARDNGKTIGAAAAFPRYFRTGRQTERVWVLGDFCISKTYRSLGPAVSLQRAILDSLSTMGTTIWYDFPARSMTPVYRRLGIPQFAEHVRFVKLLRTDDKVQQLVKYKRLADALIPIGNWALALNQSTESDRNMTFAARDTEFGAEFDALDSWSADVHPIRAVRNAQYLNWRYLQNPMRRYLVITAENHSELAGYTVFEIHGREAMVADLKTVDPERTIIGMLRCGEAMLRRRDIYKINACVLEDCCLIPYLQRARFSRRESTSVVARISDDRSCFAGIRNPKNWFLLHGDRES